MGFLSGIFGGATEQAKIKPAYTALQVQTSVQGAVLPVVFGKARLAGNLIWYGDFQAIEQEPPEAGKGGIVGGGGKGGGGSTFIYRTAVAIGLCEGTVQEVPKVWNNKAVTTLGKLGLTLFTGVTAPLPWNYLLSKHPTEALRYMATAYVAAGPLELGDSAQLPNFNFEVRSFYSNYIPSYPDADPSVIILAILGNVLFGVGFPAGAIGDFSTYSSYCRAATLMLSPVYAQQAQASQVISDLLMLTNSAARWSSGKLDIVPLGDEVLGANGASYYPPEAPEFDLDYNDFLFEDGEDPVKITRSRPIDRYNSVRIEYLNRANSYNATIIEAKDQAAIDLYGYRPRDVIRAHQVCEAFPAQRIVQLLLQREAIRNRYTFRLGWAFALLDPGDIVSLTDPLLGLELQWVRITEIEEDEEGSLTFTAEEYLRGTGHAAEYDIDPGSPYKADYNETPPAANPPLVMEPPLLFTGGSFELWVGVSGGGEGWGGANIWISQDGATYKKAGQVRGSSRMGVLTTELPDVPETAPPVIDQVNAMEVDLSQSRGTLLPATTEDALGLNTLCWVGGELIGYAQAVLVGTSIYDLSYLVRGAYGSDITSHPIGTSFCRLDDTILRIPVNPSQIGKTVRIKLQSFNIFQGGLEDLADVPVYTYTITGEAARTDLPNPTNLTANFIAGLMQLRWTAVSDVRNVDYEIRRGGSFDNSLILGRTPHTYFPTSGNGTYWVSAHYRNPDGFDVYSDDPPSIQITGAALQENLIQTWDEEATNWSGTYEGGAAEVDTDVQLVAAGNVLSLANVLTEPDLLNYGGLSTDGSYTAPAEHIVVTAGVRAYTVTMTWDGRGASLLENILEESDVFALDDLLGARFTTLISIIPQVALSQDAYEEWGVDFNGSTYLHRGSDLTGNADGKAGTLSFWLRFDALPASPQVILRAGGDQFDIQLLTTGRIQIICRTSASVIILNVVSRVLTPGEWHHIVASWDLATPVVQVYADNSATGTITNTLTNNTIDYTQTDWMVASASGGAAFFEGELAELYFARSRLDLSNDALRAKFVLDQGEFLSAADLEDDGSGPTGSSPILYLSLRSDSSSSGFLTNRGTGGNFTVAAGTLDVGGELAQGTWTAWQNFSAGQYVFKGIWARMLLHTTDLTVTAVLDKWTWSVDVDDRVESAQNVAVSAGGDTVAFAELFNDVPLVQVILLDPQAGDEMHTTAITAAGFTMQVINGGVGVSGRHVNWTAQGH